LYIGGSGYDLNSNRVLDAHVGNRDAPVFRVGNTYRLRLVELLPSEIRIAPLKEFVWEGQPAPFMLHANGILTEDLDVTVSASGADLFGVTSRDHTVRMERGYSWDYFELPTTDDDLDERNGAVTLEVKPGDGQYEAASSPLNRAIVGIADNDPGPESISVIRLTAEQPFVEEGRTAVFTLTADRTQPWDLPVEVQVTPRGAHATESHAIPAGFRTVTIPAGQTSATYGVSTLGPGYGKPTYDGSVEVSVPWPGPNSGKWYSVDPAYTFHRFAISDLDTGKPFIHVSVDPDNRITTEGANAVFKLTVIGTPTYSYLT